MLPRNLLARISRLLSLPLLFFIMGERVVAMLLLSQFEPGFWVLCGDSEDCYRLGMLGLPSAALSRLSVHQFRVVASLS